MVYKGRGRGRGGYQGGRGSSGGRSSGGRRNQGGDRVIEAYVPRSGRGTSQRIQAPTRVHLVPRGGIQKSGQFTQRRGGSNNFRGRSGQRGRFTQSPGRFSRGRGRGSFRGSGRGGGGRGRGRMEDRKLYKQSDLDADLDAYMLQDKSTAAKKLDKEMDEYWNNKDKPKEAGAKVDGAVPMET